MANQSDGKLLLQNKETPHDTLPLQYPNQMHADYPQKKFVLLSRGSVPGVLRAFQYTGDMIVIDARDLLFDRDDIRQLFLGYNIKLTDSEINEILKESIGHPLGIVV